jgi:hypothetical protein
MVIDNLNQFLNAKTCLNNETDSTSGYQVDSSYDRNAITNAQIKNIVADKILAGTITVALGLGTSNIILDGANTRIIVNDGTNDRILIGYQQNGF